MDARLKKNVDVREDFQKAKGETEFQTDGTCINTRNDEGKQEYREMKTAVCAKRECGESAEPSEWASRDLPEPNAVYAVAAIVAEVRSQELEVRRDEFGITNILIPNFYLLTPFLHAFGAVIGRVFGHGS